MPLNPAMINPIAKPRTRPWIDPEFLVIDGRRLVYTADGWIYAVHFPGGETIDLERLRKQKRSITMPALVRLNRSK